MKLSQKLLLAIAVYYINRNCQDKYKRKWDKQADLNAIDAAAVQSKLGYLAVSGTFWFTKGKKTLKLTEKSFPNFAEEE